MPLQQPRDSRVNANVSCSESAVTQLFKFLCQSCVEVACGRVGIDVSLAFDVTLDIPHIFKKQGLGIVFRVALEKYEKALSLHHKGVEAVCQLDERLKAILQEFRLRQVVMA